EVGRHAGPPYRFDEAQLPAELLAMVNFRPGCGPVGYGQLGIPMTPLETELHALIGCGHVDPGDLLYEGALVLQPEAEGQVHLSSLDVPVVVGRPVHPVSLAVQSAPGTDLLVHIDEQALRNDIRAGIDPGLLEAEVIGIRAARYLPVLCLSTHIAADGQEPVDFSSPH